MTKENLDKCNELSHNIEELEGTLTQLKFHNGNVGNNFLHFSYCRDGSGGRVAVKVTSTADKIRDAIQEIVTNDLRNLKAQFEEL